MTPAAPGNADLDIGQLLRIDVDAELRKVTQGQLLGPWQAPTELIRRSIASGATRIEVRFGRKDVQLVDDGRPIPDTVLADLTRLLDRHGDASRRHAGLAGLEAAREQALLCLAGLGAKRVEISSGNGRTLTSVQFDGRRASISRRPCPDAARTQIRIVASECASRRARAFIEQNCSFAAATIELDGHRLVSPFQRALFHAPIDDPVPGTFAITSEGDTARAWLLVHGVVATHVHITPAPPFDVAVELGGLADTSTSAADLRAVFEPQLRALVGRALAYLSGLARRSPRLPLPLRTRVTEILLQTALRHRGLVSLDELPMFPVACGHAEPEWLDLPGVIRLAAAHGQRLFVTEAHPAGDPIDEPCLWLSERARHLVSELAHVRLESPPRKRYRGGWLTRGRLWLSLTATSASLVWRRIVGRAPRAIPPPSLRPTERALLSALMQQQLGPTKVVVEICAGDDAVTAAGGRLWLPRENPRVRGAVELYAREPAWLYPIALALLSGHGTVSPTHRQRWWQLARPSIES